MVLYCHLPPSLRVIKSKRGWNHRGGPHRGLRGVDSGPSLIGKHHHGKKASEANWGKRWQALRGVVRYLITRIYGGAMGGKDSPTPCCEKAQWGEIAWHSPSAVTVCIPSKDSSREAHTSKLMIKHQGRCKAAAGYGVHGGSSGEGIMGR